MPISFDDNKFFCSCVPRWAVKSVLVAQPINLPTVLFLDTNKTLNNPS
ncbi:hypothetical protein c7_L1234 [Megavirus courdo7]|uniref:Uncharacterized protein n=1 Tax=Megavirus courdo7 TaxID=1128135 RepID=H2ECF8_9VIRU|nr:hypothetical protein c7_L1234 [Megavirus courdo7]